MTIPSLPDHLQRFPRMMPFVGRRYRDDVHKRLLVLAESHYVPEGSSAGRDPIKWYKSREQDLTSCEQDYIHTRGALEYHWEGKGRIRLFRKIREGATRMLADRRVEEENRPPGDLVHLAFYNYFQRPAPTGESLRYEVCKQDLAVADEVLRWFIATHTPQLIVVASTVVSWYASRTIDEHGIPWTNTPHPDCAWWYRRAKAYDDRTGKERFHDFLREQQWAHPQ